MPSVQALQDGGDSTDAAREVPSTASAVHQRPVSRPILRTTSFGRLVLRPALLTRTCQSKSLDHVPGTTRYFDDPDRPQAATNAHHGLKVDNSGDVPIIL
ncbi:major facilitator superfamily transporter, partial [Colletotrichum chrysophilum]